MNQDVLQGKWHQLRGRAKQRWGQLTDSDLDRIQGKREELAGVLTERYGYAHERAEREVDEFLKEVDGNRQNPGSMSHPSGH